MYMYCMFESILADSSKNEDNHSKKLTAMLIYISSHFVFKIQYIDGEKANTVSIMIKLRDKSMYTLTVK